MIRKAAFFQLLIFSDILSLTVVVSESCFPLILGHPGPVLPLCAIYIQIPPIHTHRHTHTELREAVLLFSAAVVNCYFKFQ